MKFDVNLIRAQFPILQLEVGKSPLIYFDNEATSHKPPVVIDRI